MVCGCVIRQLLNFWDFFKGESVVDFIRGDFPVAQAVAGDNWVTWLVPAPPRGFDEAQSFFWTHSTNVLRSGILGNIKRSTDMIGFNHDNWLQIPRCALPYYLNSSTSPLRVEACVLAKCKTQSDSGKHKLCFC